MSKLEKLSSESEELKEASLDNKLKLLIAGSWNTAWKVSKYGVFLVCIFPHLDWIRRNTPYLSVFIPNAENSDQKKLCIWTVFTQLKLTKRYLNSDYRKVKNFCSCPQTFISCSALCEVENKKKTRRIYNVNNYSYEGSIWNSFIHGVKNLFSASSNWCIRNTYHKWHCVVIMFIFTGVKNV